MGGAFWVIILVSIFKTKIFSEKIQAKIKGLYPDGGLICHQSTGLGFALVMAVGYAFNIHGAILVCAFLPGALILGILTNVRIFSWQSPNVDLRFNVYLGLLLGLFFGFFLGVLSRAALAPIFLLIWGLPLGARYDLDIALLLGLLPCLAFGLIYGLIECGLILGLIYGLVPSIVVDISILIGHLLKYIDSRMQQLKK